jgi:hypothetical protein
LLEDNTTANKVWALQNYYPLRTYNHEDLLKAIINRNENIIGKQAKIFALNAFQNLDDLDVSADLVAQLFNNDKILRQISAQLIQSIDQQKYLELRRRLTDKLRVELDRNLETVSMVRKSAIERLAFFQNLPYSDSKQAPLFWLYNASTIKLSSVDILDLGIFKGNANVLLVEEGNLSVKRKKGEEWHCSSGEILITKGISSDYQSIRASEGTVIHFIDYNKFLSDLYNYDYLIDYIV